MAIQLTPIQNKVCLLLLRWGDLTRKQICFRSHIPRTTVYDNLKNMEKLGIVNRYSNGHLQKSPGRPLVYWTLNKDRVRVKKK